MSGGGGASLHPLILPSHHRGGGDSTNNNNEENNNGTTSIRGWDHSIITQLNNSCGFSVLILYFKDAFPLIQVAR